MSDEPTVVRSLDGFAADFTLFSDRVVVVRYREGVVLDRRTLLASRRELEALIGDTAFAAVTDIRHVAYISKEARDLAARARPRAPKVAAIVTRPGVSEFIGRRFLDESRPERPIAGFEEIEDALNWVRERFSATPPP